MTNEDLWGLLDQIPEETVERLGLEDLAESNPTEARKKINKIIKSRAKNECTYQGYHTTDQKYQVGDWILPEMKGLCEDRVYLSKSLEHAYIGDKPKHCYHVVSAERWHRDPAALPTRRDWGYSLTPVRVLDEVPMEDVLRAKKGK